MIRKMTKETNVEDTLPSNKKFGKTLFDLWTPVAGDIHVDTRLIYLKNTSRILELDTN
jgi:hypothetical protein